VGLLRGSAARLAWAARGEARLAAARAPAVMRPLFVIAAWSALAIGMGSLIGFAAVILPPTGTFGIVAVVGVVLLWVMPDLEHVPDRAVRVLLFVAVVVNLTIPQYYTVQIASLPWISARRLAVFSLIMLFAIAISGSSSARKRMAETIVGCKWVSIGAFGFLMMAFFSIFTSIDPTFSMSVLVAAILEWYVPFLAMLYVIRDESDVERFVRVILWCALLVSAMGIVEFFIQKNVYFAMLPGFIVNQLLATDPTFKEIANYNSIRNGMWRSASVFNNGLSFAEFEAMMTPLATLFLLHASTSRDKAFGAALLVASLLGIFASGSRGGYISAFAAFVVLLVVWTLRSRRFESGSLRHVLGWLLGLNGIALAVALVIFWRRAHNIVLGGGAEAYSDQGRSDQWTLGIPKILENPITGHGFGGGGEIIGYYTPSGLPTIDSDVLSTLVETGVPSTVFFFGMIIYSIWRGLYRYVHDPSWRGALSGALGCALVAFLTYRPWLSQHENRGLFFLMAACLMFLDYYYVRAEKAEREARLGAPEKSGPVTVSPGTAVRPAFQASPGPPA